jgi:hypothetical protein
MAMSYPYDMVSAHRWRRANVTARRFDELSRSALGVATAQQLAMPIWMADFASAWLPLRDAEALYARFEALHGPILTFHCVPMQRPHPVAWAGESLTGVLVHEIGVDNQSLRLSGLPAGFVLSAGDYVSIETLSGLELFKVNEGGAATGTGVTPMLVLTDHVRPSVTAGLAVTLINPPAEMRLVPDSLKSELRNKIQASVSFNAVQVVR